MSHYASCNLGDRLQGIKLLELFQSASKSTEKKAVYGNLFNYPENNEEDQFIHHNNEKIFIHSKKDVMQMEFANVILCSGSLDNCVQYQDVIDHFVSKRSNMVYIWGGLIRSNIPFEQFSIHMEWLFAPNVVFLARTWNDFELYKTLGNYLNLTINPKSKIGGDPVVSLLDFCDAFSIKSSHCLPIVRRRKDVVVICSVYSFKINGNGWKKLYEQCDLFCVIDFLGDREICKEFPKTIVINSMDSFKRHISVETTRVVISARLHGGLLSACMHIKTIFINVHDDIGNMGDFKFYSTQHSVGKHKLLGEFCSLDDADKFMYGEMKTDVHENADDYLELSKTTASQLFALCAI